MAKSTKSTKSTKTTKVQNDNSAAIRHALDLELQKMGLDEVSIAIMSEQLNRVAKNVAAGAERQLKKIAAAKAKAEKLDARRTVIQARIDALQKQADALGK